MAAPAATRPLAGANAAPGAAVAPSAGACERRSFSFSRHKGDRDQRRDDRIRTIRIPIPPQDIVRSVVACWRPAPPIPRAEVAPDLGGAENAERNAHGAFIFLPGSGRSGIACLFFDEAVRVSLMAAARTQGLHAGEGVAGGRGREATRREVAVAAGWSACRSPKAKAVSLGASPLGSGMGVDGIAAGSQSRPVAAQHAVMTSKNSPSSPLSHRGGSGDREATTRERYLSNLFRGRATSARKGRRPAHRGPEQWKAALPLSRRRAPLKPCRHAAAIAAIGPRLGVKCDGIACLRRRAPASGWRDPRRSSRISAGGFLPQIMS